VVSNEDGNFRHRSGILFFVQPLQFLEGIGEATVHFTGLLVDEAAVGDVFFPSAADVAFRATSDFRLISPSAPPRLCARTSEWISREGAGFFDTGRA